MSQELITVATLSSPVEASLVQNQLEAAGIRSFMSDEAAVGMAWYLGNAIGGVKVQVAESDAPRAFDVVNGHEPVTITEADWRNPAGLDEEAEEFDSEWEEDEAAEEESAAKTPDSDLNEMVDRAWKTAVYGILLFPLQLYSLLLLIKIAFRGENLSFEQRRKVRISYFMNTWMILVLLFLAIDASSRFFMQFQ
ncbi:DUF2007 domain-containing protein [Gimesia sp.]|uniref:putative signal transducing protein n=1 Tax=Gimesia sp. TaxID=2024833 RepID=UPI003A934284